MLAKHTPSVVTPIAIHCSFNISERTALCNTGIRLCEITVLTYDYE